MEEFNSESGQVEDLSEARVFDSAKGLQGAWSASLAYTEGILKTAAWDTSPSADGKSKDVLGS